MSDFSSANFSDGELVGRLRCSARQNLTKGKDQLEINQKESERNRQTFLKVRFQHVYFQMRMIGFLAPMFLVLPLILAHISEGQVCNANRKVKTPRQPILMENSLTSLNILY